MENGKHTSAAVLKPACEDNAKQERKSVPVTWIGRGGRFKPVTFYGAEGCLVLENNGHFWVDIGEICQQLGLDPEAHCASIKNVPDFRMMIFSYDDPLFGEFEELCLAADQIGAWIFMIDPSLVRSDARTILSIYRRGLQCAVNDFCNTALKPTIGFR